MRVLKRGSFCIDKGFGVALNIAGQEAVLSNCP